MTRVTFAQPQTLTEIGTKLAGTEILRLSYTGEVCGMYQSEPGMAAQQVVVEMRRSMHWQYHGELLIHEVITACKLPQQIRARLGQAAGQNWVFVADSPDIDEHPAGTLQHAAEATRACTQVLVAEGFNVTETPQFPAVPTTDTQPQGALPGRYDWAPEQGAMAAYGNPNQAPQGWPNK